MPAAVEALVVLRFPQIQSNGTINKKRIPIFDVATKKKEQGKQKVMKYCTKIMSFQSSMLVVSACVKIVANSNNNPNTKTVSATNNNRSILVKNIRFSFF